MLFTTCRFPRLAPDGVRIQAVIEEHIGQRGSREVEIEVDGALVRILTMDPVFLVYACRACVDLGGTPCDYSGLPRSVDWPKWVARPWPSYGWMARWRVRLSKWKPP